MEKLLKASALVAAVFFLGQVFWGGGAVSMPSPDTVYVDDDYDFDINDCGDHTCGYDGFETIYEAVGAVADDGTVNVASGTYEDTASSTIATAIQIIGPGQDDPATIVSDCDTIFYVRSSGARVEGLTLLQTNDGSISGIACETQPVINISIEDGDPLSGITVTDNEINGGSSGIYLGWNTTANTISDNNIIYNTNGISIDGSTENEITGNTISENEYGIWLASDETVGETGDPDVSGNTISSNEINMNDTGIYFTAGDQGSMVNIGDQESSAGSNLIHDNQIGILIDGNSHNLYITRNKIIDNNTGETPMGLAVINDQTGVDATLNYWGGNSEPDTDTASGPYESVGNPAGEGNPIVIDDNAALLERTSQFVNYRPFCLNENCSELSSLEVSPDDLTDLFYDGGSITVPEMGEDGFSEVSQLNVMEDIVITIPVTDTDNTLVTLPAGTVITRSNDGSFDATLLSAAETELDALSGFDSGTLVGAFQWGVPSIGLEFDPAIRIDMYVGQDLAGQTLTLQRSLSTDGGWTNEGLLGIGGVDDGSCIVDDNGVCSFEATLASYYGATQEDEEDGDDEESDHVSISHGGDRATASSRLRAQTNITATLNGQTVTGVPTVPVCPGNFTRALSRGAIGEDVRELQKYLNASGYPVALSGIGSTGNETTYFGALTSQALLLFQKSRGLDQTGAFDAATMANLGCGVAVAQVQVQAASSRFTRDLELGAEGEDVRELQKYLNANGFIITAAGTGAPGNETTYFGELTRQALAKFQQTHNLPSAGYFGPLTRAAMGI